MKRSVGIVIDDLATALVASSNPAGIQRVVAGVVEAAMCRGDIDAWPVVTTRAVTRGQQVALRMVDPSSFPWRGGGASRGVRVRLLRLVRGIARSLPLPDVLLNRAKVAYGSAALRSAGLRLTDAPPHTPDLLVVPGAFWSGGTADRVRTYAQEWRMPVSLLVHDLFPLTHPEWYPDDLRRDFEKMLETILPVVTRIATLSHAVGADVAHIRPELSDAIRTAPPSLVAHTELDIAVERAGKQSIPPPFVLVLGTVEPRKNLLNVARAWDLARGDGRLLGAKLVIAGRSGWLAEAVEQELAREADRRAIVRLPEVTDAQLASLLASCAATVHASWAEGFGLPARESVARGVTTLLSTGIPTDGLPQDSYWTFDPADPQALADAMRNALEQGVRRSPPVAVGDSPGWQPVVEALIDA